MNERFCAGFTVDYQGVDQSLHTSLSRLMGYVQETSLLHTKSIGYPMNWFTENKKAFILTGWNIECLSLPLWSEKIKIYTWPSFFKGILATRSFTAVDEKENILLKADSQWIYTDLMKKKPLKITEEMIKDYGRVYPSHFNDEKLPNLDGYSLISASSERVKRSDTDSNRHANNVSYIRWITDSIEDNIYDALNLNSINIKYKKECLLNDRVLIENYAKDGSSADIITLIKEEDGSLLHCTARSIWK